MFFTEKSIISAFRVSLPVLMGYTTMGMAFGILMVTDTQFGPLWVLLLSITQESGSLQFAAVGMMKQLMPLAETALMSLLINIRYSVYGLSLIEPFKKCGWRRFYMIGALTDETYALLVQDERPADVKREDFMFLVAIFNHLYWIAGTLAGALAGKLIKCDMRGVDFAMTALFLVIMTDQLREKKNRVPAVIGFICTLVSLLIFGENRMLPPAMLAMIFILIFIRNTPLLKELKKESYNE
ncbi:MAG: AzlC family ABC transporter permease [Lentisphaeria bacterium]|nr:AzlC family ABC transporter permease [Lentisphaeria bacterium]MBQ7396747.1 AzlC family ABC transporter permease [Lentisphaeria bacterium]